MKLQHRDKLVMIGDSITDCGRKHPVGEGLGGALGNGYAALVKGLLDTVYPDLGIRVVNMGISGNTVLDLQRRWQTDVIDLKPDWLSVMIGINDVWRQYDCPLETENHVLEDTYEQALTELVAQTAPQVKGLVLMTPFYIEPSASDAMRATMDRYGGIVRRVAEAHGALFVDTQAAFGPVLEHIYPATLAWDRVHPNTSGHAVLARALLRALEFDWNREPDGQ